MFWPLLSPLQLRGGTYSITGRETKDWRALMAGKIPGNDETKGLL